MAYCRYCGRKLEDGEVCTCRGQESVQPEIQKEGSPAGTRSSKEAAAEVAAQSKMIVIKAWKEWLGLIKAPARQGAAFVQRGNSAIATLFILMQAIFSGIFAVLFVGKLNGVIGIGGTYTKSFMFSGAKAFFLTLLYSIILSAALSGLYFLGCKLMRKQIGFWSVLRLTSLRSVISLPVTILSVLMFLLNVPAGLLLFYFVGMLAAAMFLLAGSNGLTDVKHDHKVYLTLIVMALFVLFFFLFASLVVKSYLPAAMKSLGSLENLAGSFF